MPNVIHRTDPYSGLPLSRAHVKQVVGGFPPSGRFSADTCRLPVRKVLYTTNTIESVNARLRKTIKTRGHLPNDEAAIKLIWLAQQNITAKWSRSAYGKTAMNQFAIIFADRFIQRVS